MSKIGNLVITRRKGEKVVINHGEIVLEIVSTDTGRCRLRFTCDTDINIRREEAVNAPVGSFKSERLER